MNKNQKETKKIKTSNLKSTTKRNMFDKIDIKSNSTKHTPIKINPREIIQYKIKFNNNWNKTKKIKLNNVE